MSLNVENANNSEITESSKEYSEEDSLKEFDRIFDNICKNNVADYKGRSTVSYMDGNTEVEISATRNPKDGITYLDIYKWDGSLQSEYILFKKKGGGFILKVFDNQSNREATIIDNLTASELFDNIFPNFWKRLRGAEEYKKEEEERIAQKRRSALQDANQYARVQDQKKAEEDLDASLNGGVRDEQTSLV